MMISLQFPDGSKKEFQKGITPFEIAQSIGQRLAQDALAAELDEEVIDLNRKIEKSGSFKILTYKDEKGKEVFRHSAAHILAQAVKRLYPDAKLTIGPAVEDGFYYDIDAEKPFTPEDLEKLEGEMKKIVQENIPFIRLEVSADEAKKESFKRKEPYKLEMIDELGDEQMTMYQQGEFCDLCRGPHVPSTGKVKAIKLTKIAGAYWRGDAKNKQLQRIYGVAFPNNEELKQYLTMLEEAQRRDHKKLGRELELFSVQEEGPGFPFFHNKGTFIYNALVGFMRSAMMKRGYQEIRSPLILNKSLWLQSGHWDHYKENMYFTKIDGKDFAVKPMNCPGGILVYKNDIHSYRELPLRIGEFGLVHRHEMSGVLNGLFRVRCFTQDDAHIFCTEDQIKEEIERLIDFIDFIYKTFGFSYHVELSTRPEKAMGSVAIWKKAESALQQTLENKKMTYKVNAGDGAFYGPKIDYHLKDAIGRTWQCGTIQVDFSMPEKFDLEYEGSDGKKHRPVMLHRAIFGSIERFLGMLVEHYAGRFPLWISPVQVRVIAIADRHADYAKHVHEKLEENDFRSELDARTETVSYKVRDAQKKQINYIIVVGDKEVENQTITVRTREGAVNPPEKLHEFIEKIRKEVKDRR